MPLIDWPRWPGSALSQRHFATLFVVSLIAHLLLLLVVGEQWFDALRRSAIATQSDIRIVFEPSAVKRSAEVVLQSLERQTRVDTPAESTALVEQPDPLTKENASLSADPVGAAVSEPTVMDAVGKRVPLLLDNRVGGVSRETSGETSRQTESGLDISRETITALAREIAKQPIVAKTTSTGAVIMRPDLLTQVQAAPRRLGITGDEPSALPGAAYQGGSWVSVVERDGQCFQVHSADPLTPGSIEMWYWVDC